MSGLGRRRGASLALDNLQHIVVALVCGFQTWVPTPSLAGGLPRPMLHTVGTANHNGGLDRDGFHRRSLDHTGTSKGILINARQISFTIWTRLHSAFDSRIGLAAATVGAFTFLLRIALALLGRSATAGFTPCRRPHRRVFQCLG